MLVFAAAMCLVAALASWLRGGKFVHEEAHAAHGHGLQRAPSRSEQRAETTAMSGADEPSR